MQETLNGIVLNIIKHSDRTSIVRIYTDRHGLMAFAVPQGATKGARARNAMLMPLSLVEMVATIKPGRDLHTMRDLRRTYPLTTIYADPFKNAVAMFMCELLSHTIQEREPNEHLFTYVSTAVKLLEQSVQSVANFHICFMYRLGVFLGIQPDSTGYNEGYWFDMDGGVFVKVPSGGGHCLRPDEARIIGLLSRMTFSNHHLFRFSREQRNQVLDTAMAYFRIHNSSVGTMRSPEVLKQLFI